MRVAIRVDASTTIGTGHLMRCLTLAAALQRNGVVICFVCLHIPVHLQQKVAAAGFELRMISADPRPVSDDYSHWLGSTQSFDGQSVREVLRDTSWDCLIVDHYALDERWERIVRDAVNAIFVIDDLADRQHDCQALLDQNFYSNMLERYRGKVPEDCRLLLGTQYALLRDDFARLSTSAAIRSGRIRNLLVFFGGIDAMNYTTQAIHALADTGCEGIAVNVVIGIQHAHADAISALCQRHHFTCHIQTEKMAELIADADIAIGAGGSACWEFCSLGLPTLIVITAENQRQLAINLSDYGAAVLAGDYQQFSPAALRSAIALALAEPDQNSERSRRALALFPQGANGAERVATVIVESLCAN